MIVPIFIGKYLDKNRSYKKTLTFLSVVIGICLLITMLCLHFNVNHGLVLAMIILTGAPMFSLNTPTIQFINEVIYPLSETQGNSLINMINKIITFGSVRLQNLLYRLNDNESDYTFLFWIALALLGIIPAYLVREDLHCFKMKNVE